MVLVHGAYADGSSWSEVIERLHRAGLTAAAVQNPLTSLAGDVAHTRRSLALHDGPVILAGHSFAGTVISEAGTDPRVAGLVYIAARPPTPTRTTPRWATTVELDAGHLSLIARPDEVTQLIMPAVRG